MSSSSDNAQSPATQAAGPEVKQLIVVNIPGSGVSSAESSIMIGAIATLLAEVCKQWNRSMNLKLSLWDQMVAAGEPAADDAMRYFLVDDHQSIPDALKSHSQTPIKMTGVVLTKPIFAASGVAIDQDGKRPSVAAALFKTIAESLVNPTGNLWWQDPACGEFVAAKICDPVEGIPVVVTLTVSPKADSKSEDAGAPQKEVGDEVSSHTLESEDGDRMPPLESAEPEKINVALCDFVLPAWSDAATTSSRLDFMGVLKSPFEIASGGCSCKYEPVVVAPRLNFDRRAPMWRRESRKVQMALDAINMQSP